MTKSEHLTKVEAAYIAGFVDGEGCIRIQNKNKTSHYLVLSINQKDRRVLEWLAPKIGAVSIGCYSNEYGPVYTVAISGKKVVTLLEQIIDYMIVKKRQARVALRWKKYQYKRGCYDQRERLCQRLKALK